MGTATTNGERSLNQPSGVHRPVEGRGGHLRTNWSRSQAWKAVLGVGGLATLGYFVSRRAPVQMVVYDIIGIAAVGCMILGIVWNRPAPKRPWVLLALGTFLYTMGDAIWSGYELILHRPAPWPSSADYVYLAGLAMLVVGMLSLLKPPGARRDVEGILDAAIVAAGVGTLFWAFFMAPYAVDGSLPCSRRLSRSRIR